MKKAFTLAEVLITLGIIGTVAVLTLPILIENHKKHTVETRLKKFYSTMNQAVARSKAENGDVQNWFDDTYGAGVNKNHEFFMQYIGKYLNIVKTEQYDLSVRPRTIYYLSDGSSFALNDANGNGRDWTFSPGNLKVCLQKHSGGVNNLGDAMGTCAFAFFFNSDSGFISYSYAWDGTESQLKNNILFGCYTSTSWHGYCTRLIQYNDWKIPNDYPYKMKIY